MTAPPSLTLRLLRAAFCLWLAFVLTQPVAVHACAMRNGTLMAAPAASIHVGHPMATMSHDASAPAGETNHGCHCFGECAVTAHAALVASRLVIPAPPEVLAATDGHIVLERSFEEPDYLRPPTTAPPAAPAIA